MKQQRNYSQEELEKAAATARSLLGEVLSGLAQREKLTEGAEGPRLFFPNGVNLIEIKVGIKNIVELSLTISGVPKPALTEAALPEPKPESTAKR